MSIFANILRGLPPINSNGGEFIPASQVAAPPIAGQQSAAPPQRTDGMVTGAPAILPAAPPQRTDGVITNTTAFPLRQMPMNAPMASGGGATAAMPPQMPQTVSSIFDILRPPAPAQFDVRAAQGHKPKNYVPTAINMSGIPMAAVFGMPGANPVPTNIFNVIAAQGHKPKNYRPTQIQMNAPTTAGPLAMMQMLALLRSARGATPFSPFGQMGQ